MTMSVFEYLTISEAPPIVEDEFAAPSDIAWRIEEIEYQSDLSNPFDRQWMDFNINHLLFVELGGM